MAEIDDVLNALKQILSQDSTLFDIKKWYLVNGMIPSIHPAASIFPEDEDFEPYTAAEDKNNPVIKIQLYQQAAKPEDGEAQVRSLAHKVRYVLGGNPTLNGVIGYGFVKHIKYLTVDAGETLLLHAAELTYTPEYLQPRIKGA